MKRLALAYLIALAGCLGVWAIQSCQTAPWTPEQAVAAADELEKYRQDILDVAFVATPETAETLRELAAQVGVVEDMLRAGNIPAAQTEIDYLLTLAQLLAKEYASDTDAQAAILALKIGLRHARPR